MTIEPWLICGIRANEAVSLTVTADGKLPEPLPDLKIKSAEREVVIPCSNNTWITKLEAGDYIVYMPAPGGNWFATLAFKLSSPATIVRYSKELQAWTAATGTSDPKNPWPPPLAGGSDPALLANGTWLSNTLTEMNSQVAITIARDSSGTSQHVSPAASAAPSRSRGS